LTMAVFILKTHYPSGLTWANFCCSSGDASSCRSQCKSTHPETRWGLVGKRRRFDRNSIPEGAKKAAATRLQKIKGIPRKEVVRLEELD